MKLNRRYYTVCVYALLGAAVVSLFAAGLYHLDSIAGAFRFLFNATKGLIYGIVIAISICPMYSLFERRGFTFLEKKKKHPVLRKVLAMVLSYLILLLLLLTVTATLIPEIENTYEEISARYNAYVNSAQNWLDSFLRFFKSINISTSFQRGEKVPVEEITLSAPSAFSSAFHFGTRGSRASLLALQRHTVKHSTLDFSEMAQDLTTRLFETISEAAPGLITVFNQFVNEVKNFLLGVMISIYFLASKDRIKAMARKLFRAILPEGAPARLDSAADISYRVFVEYLAAKLLDAVIMTYICFGLFLLFGLPHPLLLSTGIGLLNVIPFVGPIVGTLIGAVILFLFAPSKLLIFLITVIAVHQLDAHLIEPRLLGNRKHLSGFWTVTAVVVTGRIFGIAGYFFGVPLFSVLSILLSKHLERRKDRQARKEAAEA